MYFFPFNQQQQSNVVLALFVFSLLLLSMKIQSIFSHFMKPFFISTFSYEVLSNQKTKGQSIII